MFSYENDPAKNEADLLRLRSQRRQIKTTSGVIITQEQAAAEWGAYLRGETVDISDAAIMRINDTAVRDMLAYWLSPGGWQADDGEAVEAKMTGHPAYEALGVAPYTETDVLNDAAAVTGPLNRIRRLGLEITSGANAAKYSSPEWKAANAGLGVTVATVLYWAGMPDLSLKMVRHLVAKGREMGVHAETVEALETLLITNPKSDLAVLREILGN